MYQIGILDLYIGEDRAAWHSKRDMFVLAESLFSAGLIALRRAGDEEACVGSLILIGQGRYCLSWGSAVLFGRVGLTVLPIPTERRS